MHTLTPPPIRVPHSCVDRSNVSFHKAWELRMKLLSASTIALLTCISASAFGANIVANPQFDGGLTGWRVFSPAVTYDATLNAPNSLGGSARVVNDNDQSGNPFCTPNIICVTVFSLDQFLEVDPNIVYDFGGQVFIPSGQSAVGQGVVGVAFLDDAFNFIPGAFGSATVTDTGQWVLARGSVQAPDNAAWARVVPLNGRFDRVGVHQVNFDNVFLQAIPEPGSSYLVGGGLLILLLLKRRLAAG